MTISRDTCASPLPDSGAGQPGRAELPVSSLKGGGPPSDEAPDEEQAFVLPAFGTFAKRLWAASAEVVQQVQTDAGLMVGEVLSSVDEVLSNTVGDVVGAHSQSSRGDGDKAKAQHADAAFTSPAQPARATASPDARRATPTPAHAAVTQAQQADADAAPALPPSPAARSLDWLQILFADTVAAADRLALDPTPSPAADGEAPVSASRARDGRTTASDEDNSACETPLQCAAERLLGTHSSGALAALAVQTPGLTTPTRGGGSSPTTPAGPECAASGGACEQATPSERQLLRYKQLYRALQDEHQRLRREVAGRALAGADGLSYEDADAVDGLVTQQLQQLLSDKATLQRDKAALQQQNSHLLQLLEFASVDLDTPAVARHGP